MTGSGRAPRQERSAQRAAAIVRHAAELLMQSGPEAVTHRSVASRAGIPFSSVGYYFPATEDLIAAAGTRLEADRAAFAEGLLDGVRARARSAASTAQLVVAVHLGSRRSDEELLGSTVWLVQAARHPALSAGLRAARPTLDAQLGRALELCGHGDRISVERCMNIIDGAIVLALVEGHSRVAQRAERALASLLADTAAG